MQMQGLDTHDSSDEEEDSRVEMNLGNITTPNIMNDLQNEPSVEDTFEAEISNFLSALNFRRSVDEPDLTRSDCKDKLFLLKPQQIELITQSKYYPSSIYMDIQINKIVKKMVMKRHKYGTSYMYKPSYKDMDMTHIWIFPEYYGPMPILITIYTYTWMNTTKTILGQYKSHLSSWISTSSFQQEYECQTSERIIQQQSVTCYNKTITFPILYNTNFNTLSSSSSMSPSSSTLSPPSYSSSVPQISLSSTYIPTCISDSITMTIQYNMISLMQSIQIEKVLTLPSSLRETSSTSSCSYSSPLNEGHVVDSSSNSNNNTNTTNNNHHQQNIYITERDKKVQEQEFKGYPYVYIHEYSFYLPPLSILHSSTTTTTATNNNNNNNNNNNSSTSGNQRNELNQPYITTHNSIGYDMNDINGIYSRHNNQIGANRPYGDSSIHEELLCAFYMFNYYKCTNLHLYAAYGDTNLLSTLLYLLGREGVLKHALSLTDTYSRSILDLTILLRNNKNIRELLQKCGHYCFQHIKSTTCTTPLHTAILSQNYYALQCIIQFLSSYRSRLVSSHRWCTADMETILNWCDEDGNSPLLLLCSLLNYTSISYIHDDVIDFSYYDNKYNKDDNTRMKQGEKAIQMNHDNINSSECGSGGNTVHVLSREQNIIENRMYGMASSSSMSSSATSPPHMYSADMTTCSPSSSSSSSLSFSSIPRLNYHYYLANKYYYRLIIKKIKQITRKDTISDTKIHSILQHNYNRIFHYLLSKKSHLTLQNQWGYTPYMAAILNQNITVMKALMRLRCPPSRDQLTLSPNNRRSMTNVNTNDNNITAVATMNTNLNVVDDVITENNTTTMNVVTPVQQRLPVNTTTTTTNTIMNNPPSSRDTNMRSSRTQLQREQRMKQYLLKQKQLQLKLSTYKCQPWTVDKQGNTVLLHAVNSNNTDIVIYLRPWTMSSSFITHNIFYENVFHIIARTTNITILNILLAMEKKFWSEYQEFKEYSNSLQTMSKRPKLLLVRNVYGKRPIDLAYLYGNTDVLRAMIYVSIDIYTLAEYIQYENDIRLLSSLESKQNTSINVLENSANVKNEQKDDSIENDEKEEKSKNNEDATVNAVPNTDLSNDSNIAPASPLQDDMITNGDKNKTVNTDNPTKKKVSKNISDNMRKLREHILQAFQLPHTVYKQYVYTSSDKSEKAEFEYSDEIKKRNMEKLHTIIRQQSDIKDNVEDSDKSNKTDLNATKEIQCPQDIDHHQKKLQSADKEEEEVNDEGVLTRTYGNKEQQQNDIDYDILSSYDHEAYEMALVISDYRNARYLDHLALWKQPPKQLLPPPNSLTLTLSEDSRVMVSDDVIQPAVINTSS